MHGLGHAAVLRVVEKRSLRVDDVFGDVWLSAVEWCSLPKVLWEHVERRILPLAGYGEMVHCIPRARR